MTIYYWDSQTENLISRGILYMPNDSSSDEELNFWRSIPTKSYFNIISEYLIDKKTGKSHLSHAPTLWSQLEDIRRLAHLKRGIIEDPFQIGYIQAIIREYVFNNIYSLDAVEWWDNARIQTLKLKILDFVGACIKVITENAKEHSFIYTEFFTALRSEVEELQSDNFQNISFSKPDTNIKISWKGNGASLKLLIEGLKVPVVEGKVEIHFIDSSSKSEDIESIFQNSMPKKIRWSEVNPKNGMPTISSLLYLLILLRSNGLISTSESLIRQFIRSNFYNLSDGRLSTLKPKYSTDTSRAVRIRQLVSEVSDLQL